MAYFFAGLWLAFGRPLASLWLAFVGTLVFGWVLNIIALTHMLDANVTGMLIARAIGVFVPPLGAVLGLFF